MWTYSACFSSDLVRCLPSLCVFFLGLTRWQVLHSSWNLKWPSHSQRTHPNVHTCPAFVITLRFLRLFIQSLLHRADSFRATDCNHLVVFWHHLRGFYFYFLILGITAGIISIFAVNVSWLMLLTQPTCVSCPLAAKWIIILDYRYWAQYQHQYKTFFLSPILEYVL